MKQKDLAMIPVIITVTIMMTTSLNMWIGNYMPDDLARVIRPLVFGIGMTLNIIFCVRAGLIAQGVEKRDALVPYPMIAVIFLAFSALFFLIFGVVGILF